MRVLFITGEFPPMQGGVGACTQEIARALVALGTEVGVLTSTKAKFRIQDSGFRIFPTIEQWDWSSWRLFSKTIREFAPDVAHIQYQTGAFAMHPAINFAPRFLKSPQTKFAVTFHDLRVPYLFPKAGCVRDWVTHQLARGCDAVVATNDEDHQQLLALNLKRLTLIPIGSNVQTTQPPNYQRTAWRSQLGAREDEALLCYFGFLNASKGGEDLMRALARVPNAKLLMIGGQVGASDPTDVAYLAKVKSLIAELGLTERVLWTDFTPDEIVTTNFLASDVCVLPYRDGASYRRGTLMAALAHGCAIVTTTADRRPTTDADSSAGKLPALQDGINCLLVPPDNPDALAEAIQRAMASPALRAKIGVGARELAQHFTWDKIARQHLDLYARL